MTNFEDIKNINETGNEFWYARDLQKVLDYDDWRNFLNVINKAKEACENSKNGILDHFVDVNKMISLGKGGHRQIEDTMLSRYACYLIVQNGDSSKEVIAQGQTYFAIKTREQEISEKFESLTEDEKRLRIRNDLKHHNKSLAKAAKDAGVENNIDYAVFQNHGYKGLYNGLGMKEIHNNKELKKNQKILDYMGSTELAANLFRATQTDEKLRRDNIQGKDKANKTHFEVGKKVRETIKDLGGTMPEDLPKPKRSVEKIKESKFKEIDN